MSLVRKAPRSAIVVRAVAFGSPDGSVWGAGLDAGAPAMIATGGGEPVAVALDWDADSPEWRLTGDRIALTVSPIAEPQPPAEDGEPAAGDREPAAGDRDPAAGDRDSAAEDGGPAGGDREPPAPTVAAAVAPPGSGGQQLCRVTGAVDGAEIDCVGVRTELTQVRPGELGSVRGFSGWVSDDEAVTLLALRSGSEAHHERDLVAATVFEPDRWMSSHDPRLSTTYDGDGIPTRATLEMWITQGEREFPRRAAGEAAGPSVSVSGGKMTLRVLPLRCHSRGNDGAGVYLLASV